MEILKLPIEGLADFYELVRLFQKVFEWDSALPHESYLSGLLSKPDFLVFIVKNDSRVIGGLTVYVLHAYQFDKPMAFIYDLAIHPDFQRRGLGKKLLLYACQYCKEAGFSELFVEAEAEDMEAVQFYRSIPVNTERPALQFNFSFL
jgi:aminoglycoside 3-N-acetyltransferase I